jgi:hypothetical protein
LFARKRRRVTFELADRKAEMKAVLEFNLPEDQEEFYNALNGSKFAQVLSELDNILRNKIKYESDSLSEKEIETYEFLRKELFRLLDGLEIV